MSFISFKYFVCKYFVRHPAFRIINTTKLLILSKLSSFDIGLIFSTIIHEDKYFVTSITKLLISFKMSSFDGFSIFNDNSVKISAWCIDRNESNETLCLNRKTECMINFARNIFFDGFNDSSSWIICENEGRSRGGESVFGERCLVGLLFGSNETMTSLLINARQPG